MTSREAASPVVRRLRGAVLEAGLPERGVVLVALSGGRDSMALLHLLRFHGPPDLAVTAAHFDHRMRPSGGSDAAWCRGVSRSWGVPLLEGAADTPPADEASARELRYRFLEEARVEAGADLVLTGHHRGDQAETVLFRAARGTGVRGLRGILRRRGRVLRPLLEVGPDDVAEYADVVGLRWRDDPTNEDRRFTRNRLRHDILPRLEEAVPGAERALARLARNARARERAFREAVARVLGSVTVSGEDGAGSTIDREALLGLPEALRAEVLREAARRAGIRLDRAGTRLVMEFSSRGSSGGAVQLAGGMEFRRSFRQLRFGPRAQSGGDDLDLVIPSPEPGEAGIRIGGVPYRVRWGSGLAATAGEAAFRAERAALAFPLTLRGRRPGDRMVDSDPVKRLLMEARIPREERSRLPFLVAADGRVLWITGVGAAQDEAPGGDGTEIFTLLIGRDG